MNALFAIKDCLIKKYAVCRGRASRGEFFSYFIFYVVFCSLWGLFIAGIIDFSHDLNLLDFVLLYAPFALFPPLVAVTIRRLHDCSRSAWYFLLLLIPIINFYGLYLLCKKGTEGANSYGARPLQS